MSSHSERQSPLQRQWMISVCILVSACLLSSISTAAVDAKTDDLVSIPGLSLTSGGYDTELGIDPICWFSRSSSTTAAASSLSSSDQQQQQEIETEDANNVTTTNDEATALTSTTTSNETTFSFPDGKLVTDFVLVDKINLLETCPSGLQVNLTAPVEFSSKTFRPRTREWYNYTVSGRVSIEDLMGDAFTSDDGGAKLLIGVVACDSVAAGFCSPFVHDQANLREATNEEKQNQNTTAPSKPTRQTGDSHGGTHVHAPSIIVEIPEEQINGFDFSISIPMIINDPGHFFMIGTLQFFTTTSCIDGKPEFRYDIANAMEGERFVQYQDPPVILELSDGVALASYITIAFSCIILLLLLGQIIKNRNHQVLKLGQVNFLIAFIGTSLMAICGTLFLNPKSDIWCQLSQPMVLIPLQVFYSITLGRLWRIHAVISPLLKKRLQGQRESRWSMTYLFNTIGNLCCPCLQSQDKLRREINESAVTKVVALGTMPQVVLQVIKLFTQPEAKMIEFNEDQSMGRCICGDGMKEMQSLSNYSIILLLVLIAILLCMAHVARALPSLLNESRVIYETTLGTVILLILGFGLVIVTDAPTTSPDVNYLLMTIIVISSTLNCVLRIVIPKLQLVWAGKEVLVSQLVEDHRHSLQKKEVTKSSVEYNVSGLDADTSRYNSSVVSFHEKSEREDGDHAMPEESPTIVGVSEHTETENDASSGTTSRTSQRLWLDAVDEDKEVGIVLPTLDEQPIMKPERQLSRQLSRQQSKKVMKVTSGKPPSKALVIRMLDLQQQLDRVNQQIMTGMSVDPKEWEAVQKLNTRLERMLSSTEFEEAEKEHLLSPNDAV